MLFNGEILYFLQIKGKYTKPFISGATTKVHLPGKNKKGSTTLVLPPLIYR